MAEQWFRSYRGTPIDPKWIVVARRSDTEPGFVVGIWFYLLDFASRNAPRGSIDGLDSEVLAAAYGWPSELVERVLAALRDRGHIRTDNSLDWGRQPGRVWPRDRQTTPVWMETRKRIFARDDYTCKYCGAWGVRLECDHVVPVIRGGTHDDDNLVAACVPCNRSKGGKSLAEWRR